MEDTKNTQPVKTKSKRLNSKLVTGVLILIIVAGGVVIFLQYRQISSLKQKASAAQTAQSDLQSQKDNLKTSFDSLRAQKEKEEAAADQSSASTSSPSSATTNKTTKTNVPPATGSIAGVGSLTLNKARSTTMSEFGATTTANNRTHAINFTLKNLSAQTQKYNIFQFTALTDTGEVVKSEVLVSYPGYGTHWNNSEAVAGGSITEYVHFNPDKKIVTLRWTPENSTESINLPIPADE